MLRNMGYEYADWPHELDEESYESCDGRCKCGNIDHEYDGAFYEGYNGPCDNERHGGENYCFEDECGLWILDDIEGV